MNDKTNLQNALARLINLRERFSDLQSDLSVVEKYLTEQIYQNMSKLSDRPQTRLNQPEYAILDDLEQPSYTEDRKPITDVIHDLENADMPPPKPTLPIITRAFNVAIVVGHSRLKQGAHNFDESVQEWRYWLSETQMNNGEIAYEYEGMHKNFGDSLRIETPLNVEVFQRDGSGVRSAHEKIRMSGTDFDVIFELHFNAFDGNVGGAEALTAKRQETIDLAHSLLSAWCRDRGIRNRGVKVPSPEQRGYFNVNNLRDTTSLRDVPYILWEPFFGDNEDDWARGHRHALRALLSIYARYATEKSVEGSIGLD